MRLRKSYKILPGIRLNITKSGISISGGVGGFRFSQKIYKGSTWLLLLLIIIVIIIKTQVI